ncbi:MAG: DMT family transporter [Maricaulaceae bacterium]
MTAPAPAPSASETAVAFVSVCVGAAALGAVVILVRLSETGPTLTAFWRFALALPLLGVWAYAARGPGLRAAADWRIAALAGVLFAGDMATWNFGILRTTAANASLFVNLAPMLVALASWLWLKHRLEPRLVAGLGVATLGAAALTGANLAVAPDRLFGDFLCFLTAFWYAGYVFAIKAARDRLGVGQVLFASSLVTCAILGGLGLALGETLLPATAKGWGCLVGLAGVHVIGQGGVIYGLGRLPAAAGAAPFLIQPVVAAGLGWAVLGEALTGLRIIGAVLVVAGVVFAQFGPRVRVKGRRAAA